MFQSISWGQYFNTLLVVLVIYYLAIGVLYFRLDFMALLQGRKSTPPLPVEPAKEKSTDLFSVSAALKMALQQLFEQAAERRWVKEELIMAVRTIVKQYPAIKATAFQSAISNFIIGEAITHCEVELADTDVQQIWAA